MKPFVKISVLVFVVAAASGIFFLKNATPYKNQQQNENGKQRLTSTTDTIIFALENIGLGNDALNKTLQIKQADDNHFRFYTDINFRVGFIGADKYSNSFIETDYNNFFFLLENCNDSVVNEITDSCSLQLNIQDTNLQVETINIFVDDTADFGDK